MAPPMPSTSSGSPAAARQKATISPTSRRRPSRAAAMSGERGAAKRQGAIFATASSVAASPRLASSTPGSLSRSSAGS